MTGSGPGPPAPITDPSSVQAILHTTVLLTREERAVMMSVALTSLPLKTTSPIDFILTTSKTVLISSGPITVVDSEMFPRSSTESSIFEMAVDSVGDAMMRREVGLAFKRQPPREMRPKITTAANQNGPSRRMALENRSASGSSPYPAIKTNEPTAIPRITLRGIHGLSYPPKR